jgi:hypothetical protein
MFTRLGVAKKRSDIAATPPVLIISMRQLYNIMDLV